MDDRPQRPARWLAIAGIVLFELLLLQAAVRLRNAGLLPVVEVSADLLATLRLVLPAVALIDILTPFVLKRRLGLDEGDVASLPGGQAFRRWLVGLMLAFSPTVYGLLLFLLGDGLPALFGFAAAATLAMVAWSLFARWDAPS